MAVDLLEYPWVVRPPVIFTSTEELLDLVPSRIIAPAEEKHQGRARGLWFGSAANREGGARTRRNLASLQDVCYVVYVGGAAAGYGD
jgi:hypothetical protein